MTDDEANNILATGALAASLMLGLPVPVEVEMDEGLVTNHLLVRFDFLQSSYRLTVERVADEPA